MYIRWIVRKHKNASTANVVFHDAYLVESFRDLRETPRQRMICYLGNIRQIDGAFPAIERELFLLRAERILASTPEVPDDEHDAIVELLRQKVPPLSEAEVEIAFRNNLRWYYRWWHERGCTPTRDAFLEMIDDAAEGIGPV
ncbi:MAG TPA: hypothetical protein PKA05_02220 [Roseiflexaceae bacterium]|nr:hypothetical protein [Roseiflexaceae bacterium]HMP39170.1 hypothetical protein [Roseiflexaceae bacterium]